VLMDVRTLLPWFQRGAGETNAGPAPSGSDAVLEARFTAARDAAIQSYRNRYGRLPSYAELEEMTPQYLTPEDRAVYDREQAARRPVLARGVSVPPRMTVPALPPLMPPAGTTESPVDAGRSAVDDARTYADASIKTLGAFGSFAGAVPTIGLELFGLSRGDQRFEDEEEIKRFVAFLHLALAAQVKAYDTAKSDPRKSYQTYTKERIDLGPCLYSQKTDDKMPCYYAGWTGNQYDDQRNVAERDADGYPMRAYFPAQLDCSTKSWVAARGREQQLIEHFRRRGFSDNKINSIADHLWRPYMLALAQQECGHRQMREPIRRE
jgi:hypothetical protein